MIKTPSQWYLHKVPRHLAAGTWLRFQCGEDKQHQVIWRQLVDAAFYLAPLGPTGHAVIEDPSGRKISFLENDVKAETMQLFAHGIFEYDIQPGQLWCREDSTARVVSVSDTHVQYVSSLGGGHIRMERLDFVNRFERDTSIEHGIKVGQQWKLPTTDAFTYVVEHIVQTIDELNRPTWRIDCRRSDGTLRNMLVEGFLKTFVLDKDVAPPASIRLPDFMEVVELAQDTQPAAPAPAIETEDRYALAARQLSDRLTAEGVPVTASIDAAVRQRMEQDDQIVDRWEPGSIAASARLERGLASERDRSRRLPHPHEGRSDRVLTQNRPPRV